jgi:transposase-like protein
VKVRHNRRIFSFAISAVGVDADGHREVPAWTLDLPRLKPSGPSSFASCAGAACAASSWSCPTPHEGIKAAVAKPMNATWQRCRVHTMRNALAHAGKSSRRVVSAFMATAFA